MYTYSLKKLNNNININININIIIIIMASHSNKKMKVFEDATMKIYEDPIANDKFTVKWICYERSNLNIFTSDGYVIEKNFETKTEYA